jgi:ABC-type multidrug transport system ATPase subunit
MLEVRNLTKKFGAFTAVDGVSFKVKPGETFALLGPNGSGKTTTLKCGVGLVAPTSGQVLINGIDVEQGGRELRSLLSYLPQRVAFSENLTAREILQFYCRLRKLPNERVAKALERANFNGFADQLISQFSGGMVQRLGIAVAFLPEAPLLMLDEPTVSLDPEGAIQLKQLIVSLKREGRTIIFSTHMLSDVDQLADRVAILVGGRLVALESVEALRQARASRSRLRLTLANPQQRFSAVALSAGATEARLEGQVLVVCSTPEHHLLVVRAIESAGAVVERFSNEEPSLEEIYLRYVNAKNSASGATAYDRVRARETQTG